MKIAYGVYFGTMRKRRGEKRSTHRKAYPLSPFALPDARIDNKKEEQKHTLPLNHNLHIHAQRPMHLHHPIRSGRPLCYDDDTALLRDQVHVVAAFECGDVGVVVEVDGVAAAGAVDDAGLGGELLVRRVVDEGGDAVGVLAWGGCFGGGHGGLDFVFGELWVWVMCGEFESFGVGFLGAGSSYMGLIVWIDWLKRTMFGV